MVLTNTASPVLSGKVALVTGATSGIGAAVCLELAAQGAAVVVGYHGSAFKAAALVERLPRANLPHLPLPAPVTDSAGLLLLAENIERHYGRCDILVNCAGIKSFFSDHDLDSFDDAVIDRLLATGVRGAFAAVRALCPLLAVSGAGLIVNVSSIAAVTATGTEVMYWASKAAVHNMTESLARALAPAIRVASVSPELSVKNFVTAMDQAPSVEQAEHAPLGRLVAPHDIALAVVALAAQPTFTSGAVISVVDGRPLG